MPVLTTILAAVPFEDESTVNMVTFFKQQSVFSGRDSFVIDGEELLTKTKLQQTIPSSRCSILIRVVMANPEMIQCSLAVFHLWLVPIPFGKQIRKTTSRLSSTGKVGCCPSGAVEWYWRFIE